MEKSNCYCLKINLQFKNSDFFLQKYIIIFSISIFLFIEYKNPFVRPQRTWFIVKCCPVIFLCDKINKNVIRNGLIKCFFFWIIVFALWKIFPTDLCDFRKRTFLSKCNFLSKRKPFCHLFRSKLTKTLRFFFMEIRKKNHYFMGLQ